MAAGGIIIGTAVTAISITVILFIGGAISHAMLASPSITDSSQQMDGGITHAIMVDLDGFYRFVVGLLGGSLG